MYINTLYYRDTQNVDMFFDVCFHISLNNLEIVIVPWMTMGKIQKPCIC